MTWARWLPLALIVLFSGLFAWFNGNERVTLDLGFAVYYQVRLVPVVFGAFLLGMISMFFLGLRHDLRVRRLLREQGLLHQPYPPRDPYSPRDSYPPLETRPPPDSS